RRGSRRCRFRHACSRQGAHLRAPPARPWHVPGGATEVELPGVPRPTGRAAPRTGRTTDDPALVPRAYRHMVGAEAVERAFRRFSRFCRERGIPIVFAGTGGLLDDRVRPVARELGFIVVDGVDERVDRYLQVTGLGTESLQVSTTDPHPNP